MLQPPKVGIARRRRTVSPTSIVAEQFAAPITDIEGRIGDDKIGFHVLVRVIEKGPLSIPDHLGAVDAANSEIHTAQSPSGLVAFLPINGNIAHPPLMVFDELFGLHKQAARPTTGVKNAPFVRFEHLNQQLNDRTRGVELPTLFAFGKRKFAQEVFKDVTENIGTPRLGIAQSNLTDLVNECAETGGVKVLFGVNLGQNAFKFLAVFAFHQVHGIVHEFANRRQSGIVAEIRPTGFLGNKEDVFGAVLVAVFGVCAVVLFGFEFEVQFIEGIGNVFEENKPENDVFVFGSVDVFAEGIGGFPELLFEWFFFFRSDSLSHKSRLLKMNI